MKRSTPAQRVRVGFLAQLWLRRQKSDTVLRAVASLAALSFGLLLGVKLASSADWHPVDEIAAAAEQFLESRLKKGDQRVSAKAGQLDERLKLARCTGDLEPFLRRGTKIGSRTMVGVRCNGDAPWKLYVAVDVFVARNVLISRRGLPRGHLLEAEDVLVEERDVSRLAAGYLSNVDELIGQRLKHPVIGGRVITPAMLRADMVVRRGQSVTILVKNSTLDISMSGTALMDGALNQRIRVANANSGLVVEGIVRSSEHVEVLVR